MINLALIMLAYNKMKNTNIDQWLTVIKMFLKINDQGERTTDIMQIIDNEGFDQKLMAQSLYAISKFAKTNYKNLDKVILKSIAEEGIKLFTY